MSNHSNNKSWKPLCIAAFAIFAIMGFQEADKDGNVPLLEPAAKAKELVNQYGQAEAKVFVLKQIESARTESERTNWQQVLPWVIPF